jgi:peptidoglycan/LPS O-acetylase OafA/YrhL
MLFTTCSAPMTRKERLRMMRPFYVLFAIYMSSFFLLTDLKPAKDSAAAWGLDLVAGVSMVAMLVAAAVGLARQRDEFQRKLLTEAMMWGVGGMLAITTVWGLLEVHTSIPKMEILMNFPIFMVITAIAKVVIFRRNPVGSE